MWWSRFIYVIVLVALIGCNKANDSTIAEIKEKRIPLSKMEQTFPFSEAAKIEVVSYPVRYEWDTVRKGKDVHLASIVENRKLIIDSSNFKDRVVLNNDLKKRLFSFLFFDNCQGSGSQAACFDPRHSVLFYNKNNEIIANLEVCLDCSTYRTASFEPNWLCYERIGNLQSIFEDAGVKYFGE